MRRTSPKAARDLARLPAGLQPGLDATHHRVPPAQTFPNGFHIVEVEIDPDTGHVAIERYTIVDDFGRTINPLLLEGQVHGGIVQGIGQALLEHAIYDEDSGQLLAGSFMDYAMPRAGDVPSFAFSTRSTPTTSQILGTPRRNEPRAPLARRGEMQQARELLAPVAVARSIAYTLGRICRGHPRVEPTNFGHSLAGQASLVGGYACRGTEAHIIPVVINPPAE
jgi:aerobic carbon-monoxide dehydrogenase large subunit